jgi:dimethylargininase
MTFVGTALVRPPGPMLTEGIVTHLDRVPVDLGLAVQQWDRYVETLEHAGWKVVEVPPADDCPDAVFVEDAVVMFGNLAVITRPGADSRKPEIVDVEKIVDDLGCSVNRIQAPGTLDGGDVLKVGDVVYVGRGGRTNGEGIRQLRAIVEPLGKTVVAVPTTKVLHLKSAVTALPDGTVIGYTPLVDTRSMFERFLPMPEESGAHVVVLGGGRVLMAADCPRSAALVADLGYEPLLVDIGEFEKLEGCVTCLSVRMRELH